MPHHVISQTDKIFYLYAPPNMPNQPTFVFFNPLTGDTHSWEAVVAPCLRERGFGTLSFDYRGQTQSPFAHGSRLTSQGIVSDAVGLLEKIQPIDPVFVGLSIGGLYAAQAYLAGAAAEKLVLINTLRIEGPRLKWIGDALVRAVQIGGLPLFRDMFLPLLMGEDWLAAHRGDFLTTPVSYEPLPPDSGTYKLLAEAGPSADWDLPYEKLNLPILVVTGLQDHVFFESAAVEQLCNRMPQARRLDLPDAGHLIPGEDPDSLVEILSDFK